MVPRSSSLLWSLFSGIIGQMKPKKSSYTFITIPSPVTLPEAAVSATTTPAAVAAAPSQDDVPAVASLTWGGHTTPAASAPSTAVAGSAADRSLSADAAAATSVRDATTAFSPAAAAASSLFAGGAAAGRAPTSAATGRRAAHRLGNRGGRSRCSMPEESDKSALRHKVVKSRSEARALSLLRQHRSSSGAAEEQQEGNFGFGPVVGPSDVSVGWPMSCSTNGNALGVAPASQFPTDVNVTSKMSAGQHRLTPRRPQSSLFLPEACTCGSDDSAPTDATDAAPLEPVGHAAATEEHNTRRRSQQRGSKGRQNNRSSNSPGVSVPSFADAALPPLAVEDAAVMLREFATMLQRLEYSGDQVLQEQKQPQSTRVRHQVRQRLSPQEQLQQQAVVCSSLSARLQRLFEANAVDTGQPITPGTPDTVAGSPGECLPQRKLRHQLRLPGIGSQAGIRETGSGEDGWPDGGSSNRIALRTLATFSTIGSNSSVSFELAQAHSPPVRSSLEQHRGRLRLAKLKEDFERLQQKHERLVTMLNIRMLLPLSTRSSTGGCHTVENSSAAPSPEWVGAGSSSTRSEEPAAATGDDALSTRLAAGGNGDSASAAAGGASGPRSEAAAAAPVDTGIILDGLDFSHFADCAGVVDGRCAGTPSPLGTRRRHSSNMILRRGGACSTLHHLASGGVGGACTPLHSLLRYNTSGTSSSGCSGGGGSVGRQRGLRCRTESDSSRFYSFSDPNSFSFGDSLLPIYVGPTHEWGAGKSGVGGAGGSASRRASSAQAIQPRQEHQQRQGGADDSRKAPDLGARWRRGESPVLFPGEASLESMWRPSRLQKIDEGFEEQQRREQLQQLRHIEECVHVLHELHVQVADEVEAADGPLAAVAAEADAAATQTAQVNRELVTANLRRSRWWGVQGGGVAAAAGVVVGGLAGGPIGAALGLIFGAFVGATSGSALEREHRHKLSRLVMDKTRRRKKEVKQGEQHMQTSSRDIPAVGADQQRQVFRGEQELVSRARHYQTAERRSDLAERDDRPVRERATAETRRAQRKGRRLCAKQHRHMESEQFPSSRTTLPQKADSAVHLGDAEWQQQQQRREGRYRPYPQGRFAQRDIALQDSYAGTSSSNFAATHSRDTTGAGATDSKGGTGNQAVSCVSGSTTTGSSRAALRTWDARAYNRRGGRQVAEHAATRRRDEQRSPNVPLPALLGLGWGGTSAWYPDRKSREAVGPQSANRDSTTLRRPQGNLS